MAKDTTKQDQIRALREAQFARPVRVPIQPAGMKPLAASFVPQPEITGADVSVKIPSAEVKRSRELPTSTLPVPRQGPKTRKAKVPASKGVGTKKSKSKGRPRLEDRDKTIEAQKPWVAAKMSRRTWYRRQAEKREKP